MVKCPELEFGLSFKGERMYQEFRISSTSLQLRELDDDQTYQYASFERMIRSVRTFTPQMFNNWVEGSIRKVSDNSRRTVEWRFGFGT